MSNDRKPDIDWSDPLIQDDPAAKAIFWLLANLKASWTNLDREFADSDWTAFRALAKKGALEGTIRMRFLFKGGHHYEEYHDVRGDYCKSGGGEDLPGDSLEDMCVTRARLTGKGERWAGYLRQFQEYPAKDEQERDLVGSKARALVLTLLAKATPEPGSSRRIPHPDPASEGRYVITGRSGSSVPVGGVDPLDAALVQLIRLVRRAWSPVDFGAFSAAEERAFERLIQAELVEARALAFGCMDGFPDQVSLTCRVTGDYHQLLFTTTLRSVPDWLTPEGRTRGAYSFIYEILEARLTDEGERARQNLEGDEASFFLTIVRGGGPVEMRSSGLRAPGKVLVECCELSPAGPKQPWPPPRRPSLLPRRAITLRRTTQRGDQEGFASISDEDYDYILSCMRHGVRTFETTPATYVKQDEEGLRDIVLAILNGKFKGAATGETFRKHGKTDIRIEAADRSAFVAECKIWDGPKSVADAVNQLLGYLTWRDGRAVVLVFNKSVAGFTQARESLAQCLTRHPLMRRALGAQDRGEWRFVFASTEDDRHLVTVHFFMFNLYCNS